jgi:hypothetical protein
MTRQMNWRWASASRKLEAIKARGQLRNHGRSSKRPNQGTRIPERAYGMLNSRSGVRFAACFTTGEKGGRLLADYLAARPAAR